MELCGGGPHHRIVTSYVSRVFYSYPILPPVSVFRAAELPTKNNSPEQPGQVQGRSEKCPMGEMLPPASIVNWLNGAGKLHNEGTRGKWPFVKVERYLGVDFPI